MNLSHSALFLAGSIMFAGCADTGKNNIEVKNIPDYNVAYVEYKGDFEGNGEIYDIVLEPLLDWAVKEDLWDFPENTRLFVMYPETEDSPEGEKTMMMAISVPENTETPGYIKTMILEGGEYAVGSFELADDEFGNAWQYMYETWMPGSGYYPAENMPYELKKNDSDDHPEKKHLVDICVPVEKIRRD